MVIDSRGGNPRLMVDRSDVCIFVSIMGGVVRMLIMCLISSLIGLCVMFGVGCDWIDLRLSRAN